MIDTILVTGATGSTGQAAIRSLIARGAAPTVMVRRGSDLERMPDGVAGHVIADFDDHDSVRRALDGVRRAYLVTPSSERAEAQQLGFVDAAAAAGLEHLVVLSQLASRADSPVRFLRYHAAVEARVDELGLSRTFLRPNLFFQGLLGFRELIAGGVLPAPIGEARVSAIDVRDIGEAAAVTLTEPGHAGRTYDLTGPESLTHADMADAFAEALGTPVQFVDTEPSAFAAALEGVLPPWQVAGTIEDYAHYRAGEAAAVSDDIPKLTGHPGRTFRDFAREHFAPAA
ncbi:MAG: SDR family oxidoreductase [Microbacteriaceae bacterium]